MNIYEIRFKGTDVRRGQHDARVMVWVAAPNEHLAEYVGRSVVFLLGPEIVACRFICKLDGMIRDVEKLS